MTSKEYQPFYFAIVGQSLHISYFSSGDRNSDYQKKYLMPASFDNNLNLIIITKFISEKIKDFEPLDDRVAPKRNPDLFVPQELRHRLQT